MTKTIFCKKLKREATQLDRAPFATDLGNKIFLEISKEAWQEWLAQQTMIINENRLSPINHEHKKILEDEMKKFLFTDN